MKILKVLFAIFALMSGSIVASFAYGIDVVFNDFNSFVRHSLIGYATIIACIGVIMGLANSN